jgi:RHS repeat-associated protein
MLTAATKAGTNASFVYDPKLRQIQKTVGSTKTKYIYSGSHMMEERNGATDALTRRYVFAGGEEPVLQMTSAGVVTYIHHDHHGSVIAQSNATTGAVGNKYKYGPFGESAATLTGTTIGYTGQRYDTELGLYHYKARYFHPGLGRFLQPDPIGYKAGMNLYTYCSNDGLNHTDPDGLWADASEFWAPYTPEQQATVATGVIIALEIAAGLYGAAGATGTAAIGSGVVSQSSKLGNTISKNFPGSSASMYKGAVPGPVKPVTFVTTPKGTTFPVPTGATGPTPNINKALKVTGTNFTGGKMGANGKAENIHLMFPTKGTAHVPGYPNGYVKYSNSAKQNVDPFTGQTGNKAGLGSGGSGDNLGPHFGIGDY